MLYSWALRGFCEFAICLGLLYFKVPEINTIMSNTKNIVIDWEILSQT